MKILIDADGCPVVKETVALALVYDIACFIICDTSHQIAVAGTETIVVEKGKDSVDFVLVNKITPGDVVITQDYGLAAMALAKKAMPMDQNGMLYTEENIDSLLLSRHLHREHRGEIRTSHHLKKRTSTQDKQFTQSLERLLEDIMT